MITSTFDDRVKAPGGDDPDDDSRAEVRMVGNQLRCTEVRIVDTREEVLFSDILPPSTASAKPTGSTRLGWLRKRISRVLAPGPVGMVRKVASKVGNPMVDADLRGRSGSSLVGRWYIGVPAPDSLGWAVATAGKSTGVWIWIRGVSPGLTLRFPLSLCFGDPSRLPGHILLAMSPQLRADCGEGVRLALHLGDPGVTGLPTAISSVRFGDFTSEARESRSSVSARA